MLERRRAVFSETGLEAGRGEASAMEKPFSAYQGSDPYIFVSYAHADRDDVFECIGRLHKDGFRIWYDEGITPGKNWYGVLASKISQASCVLLFLSGNAQASQYISKEITSAIDLKKPIVCVVLDGAPLSEAFHLMLCDLQMVSRGDFADAGSFYSKIEDAIRQAFAPVGMAGSAPFAGVPAPRRTFFAVARQYRKHAAVALLGVALCASGFAGWKLHMASRTDLPSLADRAESGDAEAQRALGGMYERGQGVGQDLAKAREWYEKAAAQGDAEAQHALGCMHSKGLGAPKNSAKAFQWWEKAAVQGHARAQCRLGWCHFFGQGVPKDPARALEWYEKAAAQGDAEAQCSLGWMYLQGIGVPKDLAKAREWYLKAAAQGDARAEHILGWMYAQGRGVERDDAKAAEWYGRAAEQGHRQAQASLGDIYETGRGVQKDRVKSLEWYGRAAEQGDARALGRVTKAAGEGDVKSQSRLGDMYAQGRGVKRDDARAAEWYGKAAG
ncbi:MAG: TIR domain-containing protein [Desulfovibrio sp.]|nr:TIR domain-containing protein [Desulfovibrio sp.]